MKRIFLVVMGLLLMLSFVQAQNDTMYVMKLGDVIGKYNVHKQVDSLIFYKPEPLNSTTYVTKVHIPGGTFTMGSPASEVNRDVAELQHPVTLADFLMSKFEITNAQYANFLNAKGVGSNGLLPAGNYPTQPLIYANQSMGLAYNGSSWQPAYGCDNNPVVCVTWYGASEFASYVGGSLPTEAQWEYACRATSSTVFNGGNCLDYTVANFNWMYPYGTCGNAASASSVRTKTVGTYAANAFGLHDMHGNVLEWCADWYGAYPATAESNPTGAATGTKRVYRGGAWTSPAKYCRSAWRSGQTPDFNHQSVGFRVVFPEAVKVENYDTLYVMKSGEPIAKFNTRNQMDSVVFYKSSQESLTRFPGFLTTNENISIFVEALNLTHLSDSLRKVKDAGYKPTKIFLDEYESFRIINPQERNFKYTVLVEDNDVLRKNGINSLQNLIDKAKDLYPEGASYGFTDRRNSLNKYISYHLINKAVYPGKFFYTRSAVLGYTPDEFLETMYSNRLIRVSKINNQIALNAGSGNVAHINDTLSKICVNGVYHLLDNMLAYTSDVENMLQNTRIRFDATSLFPEMTNNDIRASEGVMKVNNGSGDRYGFEPGYLSGISFSKDTRIIYMSSKDKLWANYQADELVALGAYDVTFRLPPVPPGTYELRYGYTVNSNQAITQIFVDGYAVGMPIDLKLAPLSPAIGYVADSNTDDNGYENDKMMRNKGYMKGPSTVLWQKTILRDYATSISGSLRLIVGTFSFTDYGTHTIRFQSLESDLHKLLHLDYLELVPKSVYSPADDSPETRD